MPNPYTGNSIVDYLKSVGQANDYASRTKLAQQYGIGGYTGTADQNLSLLGKLRGQSSGGSLVGTLPTGGTPQTPAPASPLTQSLTPPTPSLSSLGDFQAMLQAATRSAYNQGQTPSSILQDYHNAGVNIKDPSAMANVINFETNQRGGNIQDIYNSAINSFNQYTKTNDQRVQQGIDLFKTVLSDKNLAPLLHNLKPEEVAAWANNGTVPSSFTKGIASHIASVGSGSGSSGGGTVGTVTFGAGSPRGTQPTGTTPPEDTGLTFAQWLKQKQEKDLMSYNTSDQKVMAKLQAQFQQETQSNKPIVVNQSIDPKVIAKFDPLVQMIIRGDIGKGDITPTDLKRLSPQINQAYSMGLIGKEPTYSYNGKISVKTPYGKPLEIPDIQRLQAAFTNIDFGTGTAAVENRAEASKVFNGYLSKGDFQNAYEYLYQNAHNDLKSTQLNKYDEFNGSSEQLNSVAQQLSTAALQNSPYKKLLESKKPYALITKDQQYSDLMGNIAFAEAPLKHSLYGSALTDNEIVEAQKFLLDQNDDITTIQNKLVREVGVLQFANDAVIAQRLGLPRPKFADYVKLSFGANGGQSSSNQMSDVDAYQEYLKIIQSQ